MPIFFYIDLGLTLCAFIQAAAIIGLCKKTAFKVQVGLTAVFLFFFSFVWFIIHLVMFSLGSPYKIYAMYACFGLYVTGYFTSGIYSIVLGRRSNKELCAFTTIFALVPPVGTVFFMILMKRLRRDTRVQGLVFNGYAYTIAALDAFLDYVENEYIDSAGEQEFERLTRRQVTKHLKKLKKAAKEDPDKLFDYAIALAYYTPMDIKLAVKYMNKAAKHGSAAAMFNIGYWHEIGIYYKRDLKKAGEYYKQAFALGDKDAEMRLAIVEVKTGDAAAGIKVFKDKSAEGDLCARFNLALCHERGAGIAPDIDEAIKLYTDCAEKGLYSAQQRLFALAAASIGNDEHDDRYKKIIAHEFKGEFGKMMEGLIQVKEKHANDAAVLFRDAVKCRGRWEGAARLLVGTLYVDCGKLEYDRINGALYIKSAMEISSMADEVYFALPKNIIGRKLREQDPTDPNYKKKAAR